MTDEKIVGTIEGPREYMAGERVSCVVTMRPPEKCTAQTEVSNFVLSAVAVQIVGVFTYNPQWCAVPYVAPTPREVNVLFAPVLPTLANNERLLFASPPHLVGQHVVLPSNAIYRFSFSEVLPKDIAPTFKGHLGSYSVRVVVGFYQVGSDGVFKLGTTPLSTFSRTIRVVSPLAMAKCVRFSVPENTFSSRVEYGADAVLPAEDAAAVRERRAALCAPVHEAQRRYSQQICVNVMDNSAFVVRLVLPRTVVAPGQVLHGVCDFRGGDVLCQALEVHVADEETVDPAVAYSKKVLRVGRDTYGAQSCNCSCLDLVPFAVELPAHATPEFATKYTSLKWSLVFRFHTVPDPARAGLELATARIIDFSFPVHVVAAL